MHTLTPREYDELVEEISELAFAPLGPEQEESLRVVDLVIEEEDPDAARDQLHDRIGRKIDEYEWERFGAENPLPTFRNLPGNIHGAIIEFSEKNRYTGDLRWSGKVLDDAAYSTPGNRLADEAYACLAADVRNHAVERVRSVIQGRKDGEEAPA